MNEQRIDLNRASAEELKGLPGIGPVLAERIAAHRNEEQPFQEPSDIVAVSGVGERIYDRIADRLMVAASEDTPQAALDSPPHPVEEVERLGASFDQEVPPEGEDKVVSEVETAEEEAQQDLAAVPPGESLSQDVQPLEEELEESTEAPLEEPTSSESENEKEVTALEAAPEPAEGPETIAEVEQPEARTAEGEGPTPSQEPRPPTPPAPWWRRLSWLWTAMLGAVLGMIFALVVFAGINGSLDVGHSRAVLRIQGDVDSLTTDAETLEGRLEGLGERLQAMEELTPRVEAVEGAVDNLSEKTSVLGERVTALDQEIETLSEELDDLSEDVGALQQQADQTRSFFGGLQALLEDAFGEIEDAPVSSPEEK